MIGVFSEGIVSIPHLEAFLGDSVMYGPSLPDPRIVAIAGWGSKPLAQKDSSIARRHGLPYLSLEDGFLRSLWLGKKRSRPLSLIVDRSGVYYNASDPSDLENLLNKRGWEETALIERASAAIGAIIENKLSKYNHAPDADESLFKGSAKKVLVLDQTKGDMSITLGMATGKSFMAMLEAARRENPDADLFVKLHPAVIAGKKAGHLKNVPAQYNARIIASDCSPVSIIERMDKVYTVTSQMGFEALLLGKEVHCFGMPFYAGWGQTRDEIPFPRRNQMRSVEEIFAAAYILYPRYVDPYAGRQCGIEDAIDILVNLKKHNEARRGLTVCAGFSWWKRPHVKNFLYSTAGKVRFAKNSRQAIKDAKSGNGRVLIWASKEQEELAALARSEGVELVRMEDGFLRSVGLGSDFYLPYSLIIDKTGIYYDPTRPSELETILEEGGFDDRVLHRAGKIREDIVSRGITKYNTGVNGVENLNLPSDKQIVLVPGQVENDASVLLGSNGIRTNLDLLKAVRKTKPGAFILYKPHPDVEAGNRPGKIPDDVASEWCDIIVRNISMGTLIPEIDELHTITSLAGFEALLRGKEVYTYGGPFYAGWGLTTDMAAFPRRTRKVTLDELIAATLILYPSYYDWKTGMFCSPEVVLNRLSNEAGSHPRVSRFFLQRPFRFLLSLLSPYI